MTVAFGGPLLHGRWQLGPPLGSGGQGRTFLARDTTSPEGRMVAVKELHLSSEVGWKKFDLFEREVRVLRELRHPGIPRLLDSFEGDAAGMFYLVMERAPGETLRALAARRRFSETELRRILIGVLRILVYLQER